MTRPRGADSLDAIAQSSLRRRTHSLPEEATEGDESVTEPTQTTMRDHRRKKGGSAETTLCVLGSCQMFSGDSMSLKSMFNDIPFVKQLGTEITAVDDGYASLELCNDAPRLYARS